MDHETYRQIAEQSYESQPLGQVGDYELVHNGKTIKAYNSPDDDLIVGVRGTYDRNDIKTDAEMALGRVRYTRRYKDDSDTLKQLLDHYHGDVSLASHSLGGAIAEELENDYKDRVTGGVTYNPAYDSKQLYGRGSERTVRYYARGDPLSKIGGKRLRNVVWVDSGKRGVDAHGLHNFRR